MLQNASLLAIVAVDTEENEPIKNEVWWVRRHFWGPRFAEGSWSQAAPPRATLLEPGPRPKKNDAGPTIPNF